MDHVSHPVIPRIRPAVGPERREGMRPTQPSLGVGRKAGVPSVMLGVVVLVGGEGAVDLSLDYLDETKAVRELGYGSSVSTDKLQLGMSTPGAAEALPSSCVYRRYRPRLL